MRRSVIQGTMEEYGYLNKVQGWEGGVMKERGSCPGRASKAKTPMPSHFLMNPERRVVIRFSE